MNQEFNYKRPTVREYWPFVIGSLLGGSVALLAGCETSELVDVWSDASYQTPYLKKILVISVSKTPVQRRIWEDAFSLEFDKHEVSATSSYRLFPESVPDTEQVVSSVQSGVFDGILITRWLPPETKTHYIQGYMTKEQDLRYDLRKERFVTYYREIEHDGYVDSERVDFRAIDIWSTKNNGQLIWSGTSKTPEPNSMLTVRPEIVNLVISELERLKFVASKVTDKDTVSRKSQ